ncbi:MAG: gluconolactonase [Conexibacter sp.]|nr:gluconolactonase [Conexibacter sp.]
MSTGTTPDVGVAVHEHDQLGEGPTWDGRSGQLVRVDILRGRVLAWTPGARSSTARSFGGEVSAAVPREGGGMVLAIGHDLVAVDGDGGARCLLATVEADEPDTRFNDCRCDPQGRLWAGTMSKTRTPNRAALYRIATDEPIAAVEAPTTLSNGLGWSPEGDRMYFIDSTTQRIDLYDFDGAEGMLNGRRPFAAISAGDGLPDGLTVDAEGGVWVCLFGGGEIRRYDPSGSLDAAITLPTTNPTCPTFGGPDLRTLYVTTARHRLTDAQLAEQPLAGAVLELEPGVAGLPVNRFAG